jgi:hypothetical protein
MMLKLLLKQWKLCARNGRYSRYPCYKQHFHWRFLLRVITAATASGWIPPPIFRKEREGQATRHTCWRLNLQISVIPPLRLLLKQWTLCARNSRYSHYPCYKPHFHWRFSVAGVPKSSWTPRRTGHPPHSSETQSTDSCNSSVKAIAKAMDAVCKK